MGRLSKPALLVVLAGCCFFWASGQDQDIAGIDPWYRGKPGAVSLSFDDAGYSQYVSAFPLLGKYSLKATFGVVGAWVNDEPAMSAEPGQFEIRKMGWRQLLELAAHGHELAAHGYLHERYDKFLAPDSTAVQMKLIRSLIGSKTGKPVFTMHYPYSFASGNIPEAARLAGFLFCRSGLDTVNPASPADMRLLGSHAILNGSEPDSATFSHWLDQANGKWLILMYHNIFPDDSKEMSLIRYHHVQYSYSLTPAQFDAQLRELTRRDYWIAPISAIGKYITERDNTRLGISSGDEKIVIASFNNLDPEIYDQPLTLHVKIPWKRVRVSGSLRDGIFEAVNKSVRIEIRPEGMITLEKVK